MAVVAFDNSLEMMMYTCLGYHGAKVSNRAYFEDLIKLVLDTLK